MKSILVRIALPIIAATSLAAAPVKFQDHLGIQIWSLRDTAKESPLKALDLVKEYGLTEVETAGPGFGKLTPEEYLVELKARGLVAVGSHVGYEGLGKDLAGEIAKAKVLGAKYLVCPWIPHPKEGFTIELAHKVAADFNAWGKVVREAGLKLGWHPHGFEFAKTASGESAFDVIVREVAPENLVLEMDVFWVFHAGQDPAKLLEQLGGRWELMHVKDIRKGAVTHLSTGSAPPTDNVPVGDGQIDWPTVLATAERVGVKHFFIEDETPAPLQCIPASLKYLRGLK